MSQKRVAILTTFSSSDEAYSLNRVVKDQITMLTSRGYKPRVIVTEGFEPDGVYKNPDVAIFYLPAVSSSNDGVLPENWEEQANKYADALEVALEDIDVVLTHDLISQPAHLIQNVASRSVAEDRPDLHWLHWIHSVFSANIPSNVWEVAKYGREPFPNSNIVFPNSYDIPRIAHNFNVEEADVKWCPHPIDVYDFFGIDPVIGAHLEKIKALDADVIMTYPCRLDRGKQPHVLVEVLGGLKSTGKRGVAIIMDFHSTGGDKLTYKQDMRSRAKELGVEDDLIFLSEISEEYEYEAQHDVVRQLPSISNVFIMPSKSETYSLVTQEAILAGNFVILNHDFAPFRSIYGDLPKYYQFSANISFSGMDGTINTEYGNKEDYFFNIANYINYMTSFDKVLALKTKIRKTRHTSAVMRDYLEPLLSA